MTRACTACTAPALPSSRLQRCPEHDDATPAATKRAQTTTRAAQLAEKEGQALELRKAGATYQEIGRVLGYKGHKGAARRRTVPQSSSRLRRPRTPAERRDAAEALTAEGLASRRVAAALGVSQPTILRDLRAGTNVPTFNGLDAPTTIDFRQYAAEMAPQLAAETGLDPQEILALADELLRRKG